MSRMLITYLSMGLFLSPFAEAKARTTSYSYTPNGLIGSVDGPRTDLADITTFTYDAAGNRLTMTNALGHITRYTDYDGAGRLLRMINPNGLESRFSYHPRGWLQSHTVGDGETASTTVYDYDGAGNLVRIAPHGGGHLIFSYDAANRLVEVADSEGNTQKYIRDGMGNPVMEEKADPSDNVVYRLNRVYDTLNRLQQQLGASAGRETTLTHDPNGNLIAARDGLGRTTGSTYDALNRLVSVLDAAGGSTSLAYDSRDNLTGVSDARGNTTLYGYSDHDEVIDQTSPDTGTTHYSYDDAGNVTSRTDARGITTSYSYDALNRITAIRLPGGTLDIAYHYDEGAYGIGRLTRVEDPHGTTTFAYDQRGNLTQETRYTGGLELVASFAHDTSDRLATLTYPSGNKAHFSYDNQGRTVAVSLERQDGNIQNLIDNISYLPFGPVATMGYGNGLQLSRTYDRDYRMIKQVTTGVSDTAYELDSVDNVVSWRNLLDAKRDQTFAYDELDRLIRAEGPSGDFVFSYDALGNRLSSHTNIASDTYTYASNSNRLLETSGVAGGVYSYDPAGNTTSSPNGEFLYDDMGRLSGYQAPGLDADYAYNGLGERVLKTVNGSTTHFHYVGAQLLGEYDESGMVIHEYVYLNGQPVAMTGPTVAGSASNTVLQKVSTNHKWNTIELGAFDAPPVIIAGPPTTNGRQAAVVGLRNITPSHADAAVREWDYLDGSHYVEDFSILAMPPGRYPQTDGSIWEFGLASVSGTERWHSVAFDSPFDSPPAVFVTAQTVNDADTVVARVRRVTRSSFDLALFEEELRQNGHSTERIGYLAVHAPNPSGLGSVDLQGARIDYQLTNEALDERPAVIAGATLWLQEEQSKDSETSHVLERVDVLRLGGHVFAQDVTADGGDTVAIRLNSRLPDASYLGGSAGTGSNLYYVHTDHLGSPINLTDQDGSLAWDVDRLPFGDLDFLIAQVDMPLRFPGQYFDAESGLHYNYYRDYDPSTGRYIQSDPIGLEGGLNTYAYVENNPLYWFDPLGLAQQPYGMSPFIGPNQLAGPRGYRAGVPPRVQSRINLRVGNGGKGTGLTYAWNRHGPNGSGRSKFTITQQQLKQILGSRQAAICPALPGSRPDTFIRTYTHSEIVGSNALKGGRPTNIMTIITDKHGNLINTFPGITNLGPLRFPAPSHAFTPLP